MTQARTRKRPAKSPVIGTAARSAARVGAREGASPGRSRSTHVGGYHTVNATQAKNRFGAILRSVRSAQPVFIEKHGSLQAVVLDIASYEALVYKAREPHDVRLDALREEFEALYKRMQTAKARKAASLLSSVSAEELNHVAAARAKARG